MCLHGIFKLGRPNTVYLLLEPTTFGAGVIRIHTVKLYPYLGSSVQCSAPCSTGLEQDSQVKNVAELYSEIHTDKLY